MPQIIREVSIDVSRSNIFQAIVAKQNDSNSRFLKATITDNGKKITVESSSIVPINGTRPDEEAKAFEGSVNEDGTVTVPLTNWLLELDGRVKCDISIVDAEGRKLTTMKFMLLVEAAAYDGSDISEDEDADLLISILAECAEAKEAVDELNEKHDEQVAKMRNMATMISPDISYEVVEGVKVGYFGSIKDDENCFTVYIKIPDKKFACIYATAKNATDVPNNNGNLYACGTLVCAGDKSKIAKITNTTKGIYTVFNFADVSSVEGATYIAISYTNGTEFEIKVKAIDAVNESYLPITATDLPDDFIVNADNLIPGLTDVYYTDINNTWKHTANAVTELFEVSSGKTYYHNGSYVYVYLFYLYRRQVILSIKKVKRHRGRPK